MIELTTAVSGSYVLGPDSFVAIKYKNKEKTISEFALVIDKVSEITFYKSFHGINGNIQKGSFFIKYDGATYCLSLDDPLMLDKNAASVFGSDKRSTNRIFSENLNKTDHIDLVALYRNEYKHRNNERLFFDSVWNYVPDSSKGVYSAKVLGVKDSIVSLRFFRRDNSILFEGNFGFDLSGTRNGTFFYYDTLGKVRKKVVYTDNLQDTVIIYYGNGITHFAYKIKHNRPYFYNVRDSKGEPEITREGFGKHVFYDSLGGRMLNYYFKDYRLTEAFYVDSNEKKVYQYCGQGNALFKYAIQGLMNKEYHYPRRSLAQNHHGYMLIKCMVEPNGMVSDLNVIRGIDSECDSTFRNYFSIVKEYKHFRPGNIDRKKVHQEVIISIYFKADYFNAKDFYKTELPIERNTSPVMFPDQTISRY